MRITEAKIRHLVRGILSESESDAPISEPDDRSIRRTVAAIDSLIERAADKIIKGHPEIVKRVKAFSGLYNAATASQINDLDSEIARVLEDDPSILDRRLITMLANAVLRPILKDLGVDESRLPDPDHSRGRLPLDHPVVDTLHRKINPGDFMLWRSTTTARLIQDLFLDAIREGEGWMLDNATQRQALERIARATGIG